MILDAEPEHCCSNTFVLRSDGRAIGKFDGRFFSESIDIALLGRRRLVFEKQSWLGSHFVLKTDDDIIAEADRAGVFTSSWDLRLSVGKAVLERAGWFTGSFVVRRRDEEVARVERAGACSRGWYVEGRGLQEEDLILIGLVYHTILRREAAQAGAADGAAGT